MAEAETVDILELEIKAKAESAASEISNLASSVADFGKNVRLYINNLNDFSSALTAIADAANRLSNTRGLGKVLDKVAPVAAAMKAKMPAATVRAAQADWRKKMFPNKADYDAVFQPKGFNAGKRPGRVVRVSDDSPYIMDKNDISKAAARKLTQQLFGDYRIARSRSFTMKDMDAELAAIRAGYGRTTGSNGAWMTQDAFTRMQGLAKLIAGASEPDHSEDLISHVKGLGSVLKFDNDTDMTDVKIRKLNDEFADLGIKFSKSNGIDVEFIRDAAKQALISSMSVGLVDEQMSHAAGIGLGDSDTMNDLIARMRAARGAKSFVGMQEVTPESVLADLMSRVADIPARNEREMVDPEAAKMQESLKETWEAQKAAIKETVHDVATEAKETVRDIKDAGSGVQSIPGKQFFEMFDRRISGGWRVSGKSSSYYGEVFKSILDAEEMAMAQARKSAGSGVRSIPGKQFFEMFDNRISGGSKVPGRSDAYYGDVFKSVLDAEEKAAAQARQSAGSGVRSIPGKQFFEMFDNRISGGSKVSGRNAAYYEDVFKSILDAEEAAETLARQNAGRGVQSISGKQFFEMFNQRVIGGGRVSGRSDAYYTDVFKGILDAEEEAAFQARKARYMAEADAERMSAFDNEQPTRRFADFRYGTPEKDWTAENKEDTAYFNAELDRILEGEDVLKNMRANVKEMRIGDGGGAAAEIREASDAHAQLTENARMSADAFMEENSQADILQMKLDGVGQKLEEAINSDEYDPGKVARLAEQYGKLSDKIKECGEAAEESAKESFSLRGVLDSIGKRIEKSIVGQLVRVAKMRALRAVVKNIASGFSEGIGNLYQWSKGLGGPFAAAMDTIASKAMLAKNSIATAFAPAIQALVPVLNTVVNWVNAASNALAQFLALLTGKDSWTAAKESAEDWGDATKGSVGGASKAMKDLLADWDELNIIQSETGGGGGGGSGKKSTDVSDMFEERFKFDEWTRYFDDIKKVVLAIGAGIAAWFVVDTAQEFLKKLGIAGEVVDGIFSRIKKGIVGAVLLAVGFQLSQTAGKMYANGGFSWGAFATQAIGVIASGIGGVMLASAFGANPVIGLVMGIGLSLVGTIAAYNWQRNENARDYIKKRLESEVYGFDVHALVEQFDIQTKNAQDARDAVTAQLEETLGDINVLKLGIDKKKSWDAIYNDVLGDDGLMSTIRTSLEQDGNVVTMYYQIREKLGSGVNAQDEEGNYVNLEAFKIDTKVEQMLTGAYEDLGKSFAECFTDAETKELIKGKEEVAMAILEQITDAQNAAERARGRAEAKVAMQDALSGTDAETVLRNFPSVVKEQEKTQADLLRKADQEYYAIQSGKYAELLSLGFDPNSKEMKGLKDNIDEAWARITANEYELDVHAKFAEETAELFGSFLTDNLDKLKPSEIAEVYKALFPDGEVDISKILDENGLKKLREKVRDEFTAGLELDDNVKMTDEFLNEKMSELFGIPKVSGPTQEELDFIRDGVEEEFEGDPILLKAHVDADDEDPYIEEYQEGPSFNPSLGNTGWAAGQTASEETFEMDAGGSGLATDDAVNGAAADVTSGMAKLENVMGLVKTAVDLVAEYTRMTANKDFTVTINPSAAFGRVGNTSGRMYGNVTGD